MPVLSIACVGYAFIPLLTKLNMLKSKRANGVWQGFWDTHKYVYTFYVNKGKYLFLLVSKLVKKHCTYFGTGTQDLLLAVIAS